MQMCSSILPGNSCTECLVAIGTDNKRIKGLSKTIRSILFRNLILTLVNAKRQFRSEWYQITIKLSRLWLNMERTK